MVLVTVQPDNVPGFGWTWTNPAEGGTSNGGSYLK
jgi:hypothetical protein